MEPKAFLKSTYMMYMSWFVNLASSSAAIMVCVCLAVFCSALKPSWFLCRMWWVSPYDDSMDVNVLVYNLYIVLASAIGLWFVRIYGCLFCIVIL